MDFLPQADADELLAMDKVAGSSETYGFPAPGERLSLVLTSVDQRETFAVDVNRASIALSKCTFNGRARTTIVLARLDLGGAPHRNPDGVEMPCPHLHLYREGFGDKWAFPVPADAFTDLDSLRTTCDEFLTYFNVIEPPTIARDLITP